MVIRFVVNDYMCRIHIEKMNSKQFHSISLIFFNKGSTERAFPVASNIH